MRATVSMAWWAVLSATLVLSACCNGAECAGTCVDTRSDEANCGGCGIACSPAETCFFGHCVCAAPCGDTCPDLSSDPASCGACGHACPRGALCSAGACVCPAGTADCGDLCADLATDPGACGSCGNVCAPEGFCVDGACGCPAPETACGSVCADLSSDAEHCGSCGARCDAPRLCVSGVCRCPRAGYVVCGASCVLPETDAANCGGCGARCAAHQVCIDAACGCQPGQTDCGTFCADLERDPLHCGACGRACADDTACLEGRCVPEYLFGERERGATAHDGVVAIDDAGNTIEAFSTERGSVTLRRFDPSGAVTWSRYFTTSADEVGGLAVDPSGRIVMSAGFSFQWRSPGRTTVSSAGSGDVAVILVAADGTILWERFLGSTGLERASGAAFEADGDVVVSGVLGGTMDTGVGILSAGSDRDAFLITLSGTDGSSISARRYGSFGTEDPVLLAVTPDGDRFLGVEAGAGIDFGGGSLGSTTAWFVGRVGPAFEHRWSRAMVGVSSIVAVAAGADGRTYVAGLAPGGSTGSATVDFGSGIRLVVPRGRGASFVVAYAADGTALWVRAVESAYGGPGGVAVDATGRVIHALTYGWASSTGSHDPPDFGGGGDLHLVAYASDGTPLWRRSHGSISDDHVSGVAANAGRAAFIGRAGDRVIDLGGGALPTMSYDDHILWVLGL